jgi:hypothetical protein
LPVTTIRAPPRPLPLLAGDPPGVPASLLRLPPQLAVLLPLLLAEVVVAAEGCA